MRVADLEGQTLDLWAARAEGIEYWIERSSVDWEVCADTGNDRSDRYSPSTDWALGGLIIERERIEIGRPTKGPDVGKWSAWIGDEFSGYGETALVAAMRAYVVSKFGEEVEEVNE